MTFFILFCLFLWFFSLIVRVKQPQKNKPTTTAPPVAAPSPASVFEEKTRRKKQSPLSKNKGNIPKNERVSIYESFPNESIGKCDSSVDYQNSFVEKKQQSIDNELQNNIDLQFNSDEIKKGIIYSIILKRPEY